MPMGARRLAGQPPLSNNQLLPARSLVLTVATSVVFSETPNLDFYVKYSDFKLLARFKKKKKKKSQQTKRVRGALICPRSCQSVNLFLCPNPITMDAHLPYICITMGPTAMNWDWTKISCELATKASMISR